MQIDHARGPAIPTFSGRLFYVFDPRPDEVFIGDIAHAHSLDCRWTGHTTFHYSVAQHCVYASFFGQSIGALDRLMHDAPEAFLRDMSRRVKADPRFAAYLEAEARIAGVIATRFGLHPEFWRNESTNEIDFAMARMERDQIIRNYPSNAMESSAVDIDTKIRAWSNVEAEVAFLVRFGELTGRNVEPELRAALEAFEATGLASPTHSIRLQIELALLIDVADRSACSHTRKASRQARSAYWSMLGIPKAVI